ncbi:MAG: hypothetical protein KKH52_00890 [Nanoarchaeota archaeon]|nr:hypothetical protein [Nanoarchaeota archaeon]MBU1973932.1 hypothetical protein [Nanoarchaeota archaeon]
MKSKQPENQYFDFFIKHKKNVLIVLLLILLLTPLLINYLHQKPLIIGEESYYHLTLSKQLEPKQFFNNPLPFLLSFLPEQTQFLLPLALAFLTIFLIFSLSKTKKISSRLIFFFFTFLLLTPAFIFTYITLSTYALFIFLLALGLYLLNKGQKNKYFSIIPLVLAACFDLISTFLLLTILIIIHFKIKKKPLALPWLILPALIFLILKRLLFHTPLVYGPFHLQQSLADLISDFGGAAGIGFFLIILAVIGLTVTWKRKNFYLAYIFLPPLIIAYIYNTQTIFYLSILITIFAAIGFIKLLEREWLLVTLKKFTILLIILGLIFSTLTFLNRVSLNSPTADEVDVLTWINRNMPNEAIVFSSPENSYYISYFAQREPFYNLDTKNKWREEQTKQIFEAAYIQDLFPLLEKNKISLIYLTPKMKAQLSEEHGLLFLLQNERFKLFYSSEGTEVWVFKSVNQN